MTSEHRGESTDGRGRGLVCADQLVVPTEIRVGRRFDRAAIVDDVRLVVRGHLAKTTT